MTFSIAAREPATGRFGLAITTSGLCVGARCPFARGGVGAVLSQHRTDPRLGPMGLDLMTRGMSAEAAMTILTEGRDDARWRQVALLDANGGIAVHHGSEIYSIHGDARADNVVALGNILRDPSVPDAMVEGYLARPEDAFEDRLIAALRAGLGAGGELQPVRSAALLIVDLDPFPWIDVRVDRSDDPVAELAETATAYARNAADFRNRVLNPDAIPNDPELLALHARAAAAAGT
jgi:uncharacterized Ntn-hydrolase superfamily protein